MSCTVLFIANIKLCKKKIFAMCFYILIKASHNGPKGPSLLLSLSADFKKAAIENNNDLTIQILLTSKRIIRLLCDLAAVSA